MGYSPSLSIWATVHIFMAMTPIEIKLREVRVVAGMTQADLAKKTGIDQGDISRIETGQTGGIRLDVLDRLCKALKCEPGDILVRNRT